MRMYGVSAALGVAAFALLAFSRQYLGSTGVQPVAALVLIPALDSLSKTHIGKHIQRKHHILFNCH